MCGFYGWSQALLAWQLFNWGWVEPVRRGKLKYVSVERRAESGERRMESGKF